MRISIFLLSLLFLSLNSLINADNTKLSVCGSARAVPTATQNSKPTCVNGNSQGIPTASLNSAAFNNGARCGQCYELTGPLGKTVVMVADSCDGGAACQQSQLFNFIISNEDFDKIGNRSDYGNIFSLGYQIVSCGYSGNVQGVFTGQSNQPSSYNYFLSVIFSNNNVAIKKVLIKGNSWPAFEALTNQNGNWKWNKNVYELQFPATLYVTSNTGESASYTMKSKPISNQPIDLAFQFNPDSIASLEGNECSMALPPQYIYQDGVTYGWVDSQSFNYLNFTDTSSDTKSGSGTCIKAQLDGHGGIKFTREGDFQTTYLEKLSFDIKTSVDTSLFAVYFGDIATKNIDPLTGSNWTTVVLNVKDLTNNTVEGALTFFNNQADSLTVWLDNIKWTFIEGAPVNAPTMNLTEVNNKPSTTSGTATTSNTPSSSIGGSSGVGSDSSIFGLSSENQENQSGHHASSNTNILLPTTFVFFISITILSLLF
ncbi:hypothetical protein RB653_003622 [Dictyostelium firmibasis]|uniref:Expansin-like EG45 domain-containing protein n=1 Tax=Dictyostelium firmibasis TaxID=79012 RepID=A0AAN7U4W5_9MYCE